MWPKGVRHSHVAMGHGYWYAHGMSMWMGMNMCVAMYEDKMEGGRLLGRALVWCAYAKGRAFWGSAFCEQPMVAA